MSVPYSVQVHLAAANGAALPPARVEVQALGQVHEVPVVDGLVALSLPAPPRLLRLRLWCGEGDAEAVCGELLHAPDSVHGAVVALSLEPAGTGWRVAREAQGVAPPLPLQVGLGLLLVVGMGWATLRRLARELPC